MQWWRKSKKKQRPDTDNNCIWGTKWHDFIINHIPTPFGIRWYFRRLINTFLIINWSWSDSWSNSPLKYNNNFSREQNRLTVSCNVALWRTAFCNKKSCNLPKCIIYKQADVLKQAIQYEKRKPPTIQSISFL